MYQRTKGDGPLSAGGAYRAAVTSRGQGVEADAADAEGTLVISALRGARRARTAERASLASSDSGDEGAGQRPPRKRTRRLSPEPTAMHQPCTNGAVGAPHHLNGDASSRNGDLQLPGLRMSQTDQEIVRLIGQHLLSIGLE